MLNRLQDVFASFHRHNVRYVVLGGIAAVLYGVPRATFDLDILIDATPEKNRNFISWPGMISSPPRRRRDGTLTGKMFVCYD